jgi:hypothetical protein
MTAQTEEKPWLDGEGNRLCDCRFIDVNPLTEDSEMGHR